MVSEEIRVPDNFDDSNYSDDRVDEHESLRGVMVVDSPRFGKLRAVFSLMSSDEECGSTTRGGYPLQNDNWAVAPVTQKVDRLARAVCSLRQEVQSALLSQAASAEKALQWKRPRSSEAGKHNWHSDTWQSGKKMKWAGEHCDLMNSSPQSSWKGERLIQTSRCTWCHRDTTALYCPEQLCFLCCQRNFGGPCRQHAIVDEAGASACWAGSWARP